MDFARFVDLLVSKSLWLCRVDRLDDPREGLLTDSEFVQLSKQSQPVATIEGLRSLSYVNCWCQSESESMAMWDLYGAGACGVSIKTTVGALRVAIAGTAIPIHISRVKYRDWKCYQGDIENLIGLCVRKSDSYRHESEVRLLFWEPSTEPLSVAGERAGQGAPIEVERLAREIMARLAGFFPSVDFTTVHGASLVVQAWAQYQEHVRRQNSPVGVLLQVDLPTLIGEIVVTPKAQPWVLELARSVVERYGLGVTARSSELVAPIRQRE